MTLFLLLSLVLAAASLAILLYRRPVAAHVTDPATAAIAASRPSRGLALALALLVAVVAVGGYAWIGSPRMLPVAPDAPPGPGPALDAQVATLQARAEQHPTDAAGWMQAAQLQTEAGHLDTAADDLRRTLALRPNDADLMAELADLVASVQRKLDGEPIALVDRALAINPNQVKALALKGQYAMTQRDFRTMLEAWNHAIDVAPPGDPIAAFLKRRLDSLRAAAAAAGNAPASAPAGR
jgi:cytochrome c-type biogenesis protein CcmH